jgi:hypothetical protein
MKVPKVEFKDLTKPGYHYFIYRLSENGERLYLNNQHGYTENKVRAKFFTWSETDGEYMNELYEKTGFIHHYEPDFD